MPSVIRYLQGQRGRPVYVYIGFNLHPWKQSLNVFELHAEVSPGY